MAKRRRKRETGGIYLRGGVYWINYRVEGERFYESTETANEREARAFLAKTRRAIREGTWLPPDAREAEPAEEEILTAAAWLTTWIERRREAGVQNVRDESRWMREHAIPTLGALPLANVTRAHVREFVVELRRKPRKRTGKPYAPRTVLHIYRTLATAFGDAVLDGLIPSTPCTLRTRKGELPAKKDASPEWRAEAVYTREEAETLLSAESLPLERRVLYGLMLLAGLRGSEATGRRWRDYDPNASPLGRLAVVSQADGNKGERAPKKGVTRNVPVVPALASLLAEWKLRGFALRFGRHPQPDEPIVPAPRSKPGRFTFRGGTTVYTGLVRDLEALGARRVPALRHSMRATFLSILEADGANMAIARRATHSAPSDVVGGYIRVQWADVCREVAKLGIELRRGAKILPLRLAAGDSSGDNRAVEEGETLVLQGGDSSPYLTATRTV